MRSQNKITTQQRMGKTRLEHGDGVERMTNIPTENAEQAVLHEQPQAAETADACRENCTQSGTRSDCQGAVVLSGPDEEEDG
jgi:hypothetical protein